jgi:glycosyltransferase involved in cell wall biosynthesis
MMPCSNVSPKNKIILSVGRFTTDGHGKKQLEMMKIFGEMTEIHAQGWEYKSLGGLSERKEDIAYFDSVRCLGKSLPVHVYANAERSVLQVAYRDAQIFWHAAGYEEDNQAHPELQEHFGISTVEAMGAGCVPLAFNGGGQREIIQHGLNGFLWNDLAELKDYTLQLIGDDCLRGRMSEAASLRAKSFSKQIFVRNLLKLCDLDPVSPGIR